jgi:hypothetical protein
VPGQLPNCAQAHRAQPQLAEAQTKFLNFGEKKNIKIIKIKKEEQKAVAKSKFKQ